MSEIDLLNGANAVAIGDGETDAWEIFQFGTATLVGEDLYDISLRLRGQSGTDAIMPPVWPAGSLIVPLTSALVQIGLAASERGLVRTYRIGPSNLPVDDPVHVETTRSFLGVGLRPFAPVHLRARPDGVGGTAVSWIRRTRIDGDGWLGLDVPLGEEREQYLVRVLAGSTLVREVTVTGPAWNYGAAEKASDQITGPYAVEIAQLSDRFGPGPFGRIVIDD